MALSRTVAQDTCIRWGTQRNQALPPTALVVNFVARMDIEKLTLIVDVEAFLLPNPAG